MPTGIIAFVLSVIASSIFEGSILNVFGSISTNTGFAPIKAIISAVEIHVYGTVMTSSPASIPNAINAINNASEPLDTVIQCFTPTNSANCFSHSLTSGPKIYFPWSRTLAIAASISSRKSFCCVFKSMKSTFDNG